MLLLICCFNSPWRHILQAFSQIPAFSVGRGLSAALAQGNLGGEMLHHCRDLTFIDPSTSLPNGVYGMCCRDSCAQGRAVLSRRLRASREEQEPASLCKMKSCSKACQMYGFVR